jgi:hypothetical protein
MGTTVASSRDEAICLNINQEKAMDILALTAMPVAAIGYSILYLLMGGGLGGAFIIFVVAKMLGR